MRFTPQALAAGQLPSPLHPQFGSDREASGSPIAGTEPARARNVHFFLTSNIAHFLTLGRFPAKNPRNDLNQTRKRIKFSRDSFDQRPILPLIRHAGGNPTRRSRSRRPETGPGAAKEQFAQILARSVSEEFADTSPKRQRGIRRY
jgi:hypothetical protein